jgi:hypothetical protein
VPVHRDRNKLDILVVFIGIQDRLHNGRGFRRFERIATALRGEFPTGQLSLGRRLM